VIKVLFQSIMKMNAISIAIKFKNKYQLKLVTKYIWAKIVKKIQAHPWKTMKNYHIKYYHNQISEMIIVMKKLVKYKVISLNRCRYQKRNQLIAEIMILINRIILDIKIKKYNKQSNHHALT
jgi:hypothetical protein